MTDCLFCRIAAGDVPAEIILEDDDLLAFRDIQPQAPVHVLIIPRRHIESLSAATAEDIPLLGKVARAAALIAAQEGIEASGYRCVMNNGPDAQQSVPHLHLHVLGGRSFSWPPG
jgi:histidine triad (HIT) family protein